MHCVCICLCVVSLFLLWLQIFYLFKYDYITSIPDKTWQHDNLFLIRKSECKIRASMFPYWRKMSTPTFIGKLHKITFLACKMNHLSRKCLHYHSLFGSGRKITHQSECVCERERFKLSWSNGFIALCKSKDTQPLRLQRSAGPMVKIL